MGIYRFFEIFVAPEQFLCYYMRCKFRELINAQIAQLVEQRTENPRVAGSIPALGIFLFFRHALEKSRPRRGGLIYFVSISSNVSFSISLDVTCIA